VAFKRKRGTNVDKRIVILAADGLNGEGEQRIVEFVDELVVVVDFEENYFFYSVILGWLCCCFPLLWHS